MTLFVNLYGGPASGKSTTAYLVTGKLKSLGVNAEMTPEFAKFLVWDDRQRSLDNQIYVTAKQYHMMKVPAGKADVVITDSPVLLGIVYAKNFPPSWHQTLKWCHDQVATDGLHYFIRRGKAFEKVGRRHDYAQSVALDQDIKCLLLEHDIDYTCVDRDDAADKIVSRVWSMLNGE